MARALLNFGGPNDCYDRRKLMVGGAVGAAAAVVTAMPAIASGLKTLLAPTSEGSRIFPVVVKSDLYGPDIPKARLR